MEKENTADTTNDKELTETLLNVSDSKQSLNDIVHYHNYETANPEGLYIFEDRPKLTVNGKVTRQRIFVILSSKEKTKLPPRFNKDVSNVIIDVLPSTIKRNLKTSIKKSPKDQLYHE